MYPLFDVYPQLKKLPFKSLSDLPTPVEHFAELGESLGNENLWIKRNDLISSTYGGNKIRKLEFLLPDAIEKGHKTVSTIGGIGSNHCLATVIYAKELGLNCELYLYEQPCTDHCRKSLRLYHKYGAKIFFAKSYPHIALKMTKRLLLGKLNKNKRIYSIPPGGSAPLGVLGHVNAIFELKAQIEQKLCPKPEAIYAAQGSNGTSAGLLLGLKLANLDIDFLGVRVFPAIGTNSIATMYLANQCLNLMKKQGANVALDKIRLKDVKVVDGYLGDGYGCITEGGQSCVELAQKYGIALDTTYTGKAFAALKDALPNYSGKPVMFWDTFNSVDLSQDANSVEYQELPENLHQFFKEA